MTRPVQVPDVPAHIELAYEHGVPVAVNGVAMSLSELTDIVATIAGDHGEASGELVLGDARNALMVAPEGNGVVCIKLHHGEHTVLSVSPISHTQHS